MALCNKVLSLGLNKQNQDSLQNTASFLTQNFIISGIGEKRPPPTKLKMMCTIFAISGGLERIVSKRHRFYHSTTFQFS